MIKPYPPTIDENISRPVATTVFTIGLITILRPEFNWLVILLFVDFGLRYIHPKLSPLVWITRFISRDILHLDPVPYYSPPKRFAIFIGLIITGLMSLMYFLNLQALLIILTVILLFAANLQGFFGYCVGCKVYDLLIKMGIFRQYNFINPEKLHV